MEVAETMKKPHVAILPSPGMGHVIPLLELAKRLVIHHNFHISFLVITTEASAAQNQLLQSPTLPHDLQVINLPHADMSNIVHDDMPALTRLCLIAQESLRFLKPVLSGLNHLPQALVIDLFSTGAFEICKELSIPIYSFFTASTSLLTFSLYLPTLDRETDCEFVDLPGPVHVPGCRLLRTKDLLDQVQNRKIDDYKWYLRHVSRLPYSTGILLNTWEDFGSVDLRALRENDFFKQIPIPPVYSIGPLTKEDEPVMSSNDTCLDWLDKQPSESVLFVSFGSGGTLSTEQLTELALGLELSQQRFIWVVRSPSDVSASGAFFNVGDDVNDPMAYLPDGFLKRTQETGLGLIMRSWAAQVAVLRHPSTGGFLSHCGWNSILESIVHGVPIIAWPLYAEQKMNATMLVEEVGVAIRPVAKPGKKGVVVVRREEVERVVRLVMEGEERKVMRSKINELKESAHNALCYGVVHLIIHYLMWLENGVPIARLTITTKLRVTNIVILKFCDKSVMIISVILIFSVILITPIFNKVFYFLLWQKSNVQDCILPSIIRGKKDYVNTSIVINLKSNGELENKTTEPRMS